MIQMTQIIRTSLVANRAEKCADQIVEADMRQTKRIAFVDTKRYNSGKEAKAWHRKARMW